jgi:predicted RNA-binding protein YlqC (UPF0109 family)
VSAFDDEFGLFGDEVPEDERRSTLGARKIASGETIIDEIEPEDERPERRRGGEGRGTRDDRPPRRDRVSRPPADPAKKLVDAPDAVVVATTESPRGPVIELEVDGDDLGKVIGRGGRVAQALRTLVRASAEGRVIIDILDSDDDDVDDDEEEETSGDTDDGTPAE